MSKAVTGNPNKYDDAPKDKKSRMRVLTRLGKYILMHKWLALCAMALMIVSNLCSLAGPKISGKAIGAIQAGGDDMMANVLKLCALLLMLYIASVALSYILSIIMIKLSQRIVRTMRRELFNKLMELPVNFFDTHQTGDIISHISYDIDTVNTSLSHDLLQICTSVITVIGSLIMMITICPPLVLIFAITVPCSIFFSKYRAKVVRPLFRARSRSLGELNGYAEEMLSGQKTIKAYAKEQNIIGKFANRNKDAVSAYYKADYEGAIMGPSINFINNVSISLITIFGGILYMLTQSPSVAILPIFAIELDGIASFVQYSRKFAGPINEFANIISDLQSSLAAAERVFRIIDDDSEPADAFNAYALENCRGDVDIENISFGYTPQKTIIKDLSLKAEPGSTVAIVGPTGAGKTTIINLLMRFYDPQSGKICVDGNEHERYTRESLRHAYTMVLQDTWLFYGTIYDNIAYGKPDATMDDVIRAAKAANIHSYIESLPDGYNTILSDDGVNISKGQKQLITIARAMLLDSPMLILDEATSNVDSRTEVRIGEAMKTLMQGRTSFVIAHRLSTIQNADMILVIQNGAVAEKGTHEELLRLGGIYSSLYNSQFKA